ncbi:MAG: hypothetical protein ABRQ37_04685 [Candidatus Eremiobacterota bacterium]
MVKKIFILLVIIFICHIAVEAQETKEQPLPNLTVSDDDYMSTRTKIQGNSQNNPYDGYYDPARAHESFNFRSDRNVNNYPGNNESGNGYSGYYKNSGFEEYQFPQAQATPVPPRSNAIELSDSDLLKDVDIKSGGIPVWKQSNNAVVEVDKIQDMNVSVFLLTQQNNNNVIGYNIEFRSNRDLLAFTSFILEGKSQVYLLNKEDTNRQEKIGNFMTEGDPSGICKKIMTFSYKGKEIKLKILEKEQTHPVTETVPDRDAKKGVTENPEDTKSNTVIEVNF